MPSYVGSAALFLLLLLVPQAHTCPAGLSCWFPTDQPRVVYVNFTDSDDETTAMPSTTTKRSMSNVRVLYVVNHMPNVSIGQLLCELPALQQLHWYGPLPIADDNSTCGTRPPLPVLLLNVTNTGAFPARLLAMTTHDVRRLILVANDITELNASSLLRWRKLDTLDVSYNRLTVLSADLFVNNTLVGTFNASNNLLESLPADLLSPLADLKHLVLRGNQLTDLRFLNAASQTLTTLDVSGNSIQQLRGEELRRLTSLVVLDVSSNALRSLDAEVFGCALTRLETLDLHGNGLTEVSDHAFAGMVGLVTLNLAHNSLTSLRGRMFTASAATNATSLCIPWGDAPVVYGHVGPSSSSSSSSSSSGATRVRGKAIKYTKTSISAHNAVYAAGDKVDRMSRLGSISKPWYNFHTLDASFNKINTMSSNCFSRQLAYVRRIDMAYNRLQTLPRDGLEHLLYLDSVNFTRNKINWLDVGAFNNPRLRVIDLSHNRLTKIISMVFLYLPALEQLDLSHNRINYIYKMAFYRTCKHGQAMDINLEANSLREDAMVKIVNCFKHLQDTTCSLDVRLQHNAFEYFFQQPTLSLRANVQTQQSKYFRVWDHVRFDVGQNALRCDCRMHADLGLLVDMRALVAQDHFLHADNLDFWRELRCTEPSAYDAKPLRLFYDLASETCGDPCPSGCECRAQASYMTVDCSYRGLQQMPVSLPPGPKVVHFQGNDFGHVTRLPATYGESRAINFSFSGITEISEAAWDTLVRVGSVDLQGNSLRSIPVDVSRRGACMRSIRLGRNPLRCGCGNEHVVRWLLNCSDSLVDLDDIRCDDGSFFLDAYGQACDDADDRDRSLAASITLTMISMAATFLLGVAALSLAYYFRRRLVACFLLRQRPAWYRVHAADDTAQYDALVLYCRDDADAVLLDILPTLQRGGQYANLCLQHRDWSSENDTEENFSRSVGSCQAAVIVVSASWLQTDMQNDDYNREVCRLLSSDDGNVRVCVVAMDDTHSKIECGPHVVVVAWRGGDKEEAVERLLAALPRPQRIRSESNLENENLATVLIDNEKY